MSQDRHQTPAPSDRNAWSSAAIAGAAILGASALHTRWRTARAERRHPPHGRFMELDGIRLHYVDAGGSGPPVLLLHGNGGMIADFEVSGVLGGLAREHRVICFDRPGFGYTERPRDRVWTPFRNAELLLEAAKRLGAPRPVLVGQSWGTLPALSAAISFPDRVAGLVLISGYYFPTLRADVPLLAPPAIPILGDLVNHTIGPMLAGPTLALLLPKIFAPREIPERFLREFPLELTRRPTHLRASAEETAMMIPAAAALRPHYREIAAPVSIIHGEGDAHIGVGHAVRLHQEIAGSELVVLGGLGHMLHHFAPGEVVEAVRRLLRRDRFGQQGDHQRVIAPA